jgi:hypothetical protein
MARLAKFQFSQPCQTMSVCVMSDSTNQTVLICVALTTPIGRARPTAHLQLRLAFFKSKAMWRTGNWTTRTVFAVAPGLSYQVTPNFSVDVDSFFGLNHSAPDYNVFVGFGRRF